MEGPLLPELTERLLRTAQWAPSEYNLKPTRRSRQLSGLSSLVRFQILAQAIQCISLVPLCAQRPGRRSALTREILPQAESDPSGVRQFMSVSEDEQVTPCTVRRVTGRFMVKRLHPWKSESEDSACLRAKLLRFKLAWIPVELPDAFILRRTQCSCHTLDCLVMR